MNKNITVVSFKNRIQYLLVMIVLISLALFGGGTVYFIKNQYEEKNKEAISDKLLSVKSEISKEKESTIDVTKKYSDYLSFLLKEISAIHLTDINLFNLSGDLVASSRPKVFEEGLISQKMSPKAFYELSIKQKLQYIHDENIGQLDYLSAYTPLRDDEGKVIAYLNIPYFSRQSDLEKEISTFLTALVNIYVLLFGLSVIIAFIISGYVTQPLALIQEKLAKLKLGNTNEIISWEKDDEIGSLVKEYNRMISELAKSAELLAKSERESAWREMAKQVAHEIKNPLTPMKLSVQYLQRSWNENESDKEKKIERISQTLIEQIDALSNIANEFSNFAQMPKAKEEKICINELIENTIHLHRSFTHVQFLFKNETNSSCYILSDKEQWIRIFNNLVKNAIQAIPETKEGHITIILSKNEQQLLIAIQDNGTGIPAAIQTKIFTPSFTTKTAGMGLGLAMVKSIIETAGGKISFSTAENKGTTFYITINEFQS